MKRPVRATRVPALLSPCAVLLIAACGSPPEHVTHDLAARLSEARVLRETGRLDLGAAAARRHLYEGWSRDEVAADGTSFAWSSGEQSTLRLFLAEPRALALSFRCWPFSYPGAPPQVMAIEVNGQEVAKLALAPDSLEHRVALPRAALRGGENHVSFRYAWHRAPSEVLPGAHDTRSLAVGWDWLRVEGAAPGASPSVAGGGLRLPGFVRVDYLLERSHGASLRVDRIEGEGRGLRVTARTLEGAIDMHFAPGERVELPLGDASASRLLLLSLQAEGGSLRLARPRITGTEAAGPEPERSRRRPHIVLYVADTLRADQLGAYGRAESPSPRLDAFAAEAAVFDRAQAQSSWTKSSMASLFTGLTPPRHGAVLRDSALSSALDTLAERVQRLGYATAGLVTNPNLVEVFGFAQGFDSYEFLAERDRRRGYVRSDVLTDRAVAWLSERRDDRPFFLYLHSMDPHDPYRRPGSGPEASEVGSTDFMTRLGAGVIPHRPGLKHELLELYRGEIRGNDEQFGRLLDHLRGLGLYDDALVLFVSDHGEEFLDHGWWRHGKTLYQEQLHVPLIVKWPGGWSAGRRVHARAQQVDLLPTLLDYLGEPAEPGLSGRSLLPLVEGGVAAPERASASHLELDGRRLESLLLGDTKLVRTLAYDRPTPAVQLFRLGEDPAERDDRAPGSEAAREFLLGVLAQLRATARPPRPETARIDPELADRLRALGYLQ